VTRGDLVTVTAHGHYAGKPRPAVIVQSDLFAELGSVAVCLLASERVDAPLFRLDLEPEATGLAHPSQVMIDKIVTVPRSAIGDRIGTLERDDLVRVDRALALFLGIA
jgi:mRNA interferase MazF